MGHGGTYRAMLPLVLHNIDHPYTVSHPIGNTSTVVAAWQSDHLECIDWCGQPVE